MAQVAYYSASTLTFKWHKLEELKVSNYGAQSLNSIFDLKLITIKSEYFRFGFPLQVLHLFMKKFVVVVVFCCFYLF